MIYGLWSGCMCVRVCLDGGEEVNLCVHMSISVFTCVF